MSFLDCVVWIIRFYLVRIPDSGKKYGSRSKWEDLVRAVLVHHNQGAIFTMTILIFQAFSFKLDNFFISPSNLCIIKKFPLPWTLSVFQYFLIYLLNHNMFPLAEKSSLRTMKCSQCVSKLNGVGYNHSNVVSNRSESFLFIQRLTIFLSTSDSISFDSNIEMRSSFTCTINGM